MLSDHSKNSPPTPEPRPMRTSSLGSGPYSRRSEDLEYAHSNSNRKPDLSTDEPPPYKMANNTNDQVGVPLLQAMPPQPVEGQPTIQPVKENLFWRFCKYIQNPWHFSFHHESNFTFDMTFKYVILAILICGFLGWLYWGGPKTP